MSQTMRPIPHRIKRIEPIIRGTSVVVCISHMPDKIAIVAITKIELRKNMAYILGVCICLLIPFLPCISAYLNFLPALSNQDAYVI